MIGNPLAAIDSVIHVGALWLLTYAIHSTVLLALGCGVIVLLRSDPWKETVWKSVLFGAVVTTSIQIVLGFAPLGGVVHADSSSIGSTAVPLTNLSSPAVAHSYTSLASQSPVDLEAPAVGWPTGWPEIVMLLWLSGVVAIGVHRLPRHLRVRRVLQRRTLLDSPALTEMLEEIQQRADVRYPIHLYESSCPVPLALGANAICVPRRFVTELDAPQQRAGLAHEVAHLVRRDPAWKLAVVAIETAFYFQPLNRVARKQLCRLAEYRADEWAAARTGAPLELASCLAAVARWLHGEAVRPRYLTAAVLEGRSPLFARVQRLIRWDDREPSISRRVQFLVAASTVAWAAAVLPNVSSTSDEMAAATIDAGREFRWTGPATGRRVEVRALNGSVDAIPGDTDEVEVVARHRHDRDAEPEVRFVESDDRLLFCAVLPDDVARKTGYARDRCSPNDDGRFKLLPTDPAIDFTVRIPTGIAFDARSLTGRVEIRANAGDVAVSTMSGDIDIATTGSIRASSMSGDITLTVHEPTDATVSAQTNGHIRSDVPIRSLSSGPPLQAKSMSGDIVIRGAN